MAQNFLSKKRNLGGQIKELSRRGLSYRQIEKRLKLGLLSSAIEARRTPKALLIRIILS